MIPNCRYTVAVVESAIHKYILTRTSYRKIAEEIAAGDFGDELPPCHVQIFNWVKRFAGKAAGSAFKLQKEMALRGLYKKIQDCDHRSICPNSHLAHTKRKASQLDSAREVMSQLKQLNGQVEDLIFGLQTYFLKQVENCEAILSGRAVAVTTPHSGEHVKRNSSLDCLSVTEHRGQNIERERPHEVGAIPIRSDSAVDSCELGKSSTMRSDERDIVSPTFESGWG
jgi:hypothetical protein